MLCHSITKTCFQTILHNLKFHQNDHQNLYPYHYNHHHYNLYFEFYNVSYQHNDNVE